MYPGVTLTRFYKAKIPDGRTAAAMAQSNSASQHDHTRELERMTATDGPTTLGESTPISTTLCHATLPTRANTHASSCHIGADNRPRKLKQGGGGREPLR